MALLNDFLVWATNVFGPYGLLGLFVVAFAESSFFPVPPDLLIISFGLANPESAFLFAFVATLGSVLGGMFGYWLGNKLGEPLLEKITSKKTVKRAHDIFAKYDWIAVFIAGFTPIPYKVFTILSGTLFIDFKRFVLASIASRGARFFLEAIFIFYFGQQFLGFFDKYFELLTFAIAGIVLVLWLLLRKKKSKKALSSLNDWP